MIQIPLFKNKDPGALKKKKKVFILVPAVFELPRWLSGRVRVLMQETPET